MFARKHLNKVLYSEQLLQAYADDWKTGFFKRRAGAAHDYRVKNDPDRERRPGGSKKKKSADSTPGTSTESTAVNNE
jgi:hypothetical protein